MIDRARLDDMAENAAAVVCARHGHDLAGAARLVSRLTTPQRIDLIGFLTETVWLMLTADYAEDGFTLDVDDIRSEVASVVAALRTGGGA